MATADGARRAEVGRVLDAFCSWAARRPDVVAVGLAGSQARGAARDDSDVDLVVLTGEPASYLSGSWAQDALPAGAHDLGTRRWGVLLERRFRLPSGLEVECGFGPPTWAAVPVDAGTRRVVGDGFVVLHDPSGLLGHVVRAVAQES